jgi:hypothetical protein
MVDVVTSIVINRPIEEVASYAMDPMNAPEWYVNIKKAEWVGERWDQDVRMGSKVAFIAHFLGKKLSYVYEVVQLTDLELIMKTADGPFPMETAYQFEKIDFSTTRMILRNHGKPTGFSALMTPFITMMMRKANRKDLEKIKSILEKKA